MFIRYLGALGTTYFSMLFDDCGSFLLAGVPLGFLTFGSETTSSAPSSLFSFGSDMLQVKRAMIDTISRFIFSHIFYSVLVDMISVVSAAYLNQP